MTKQELEQIYYLNRELKVWEDELSRLRAKSLVQSPVGSGSHGSAVADKVAQRGERVVELENRIKAKRDEIAELSARAEIYITTISDSLIRQILFYRCVKLYGWRKVAYMCGGRNSEDSIKKIYQRFFKRQQKSCPECPD